MRNKSRVSLMTSQRNKRRAGKVTDQEIRCAILEYAYNRKKEGRFAENVLGWITSSYKIDNKKVQAILRSLENEGLIKSSIRGRVVYTNDKVITEKGERQYLEKYESKAG